jgi:hypothetical protein
VYFCQDNLSLFREARFAELKGVVTYSVIGFVRLEIQLGQWEFTVTLTTESVLSAIYDDFAMLSHIP